MSDPVDTASVSVGSNSTEAITLSFDDTTDAGYRLTVDSDDDSDTALATAGVRDLNRFARGVGRARATVAVTALETAVSVSVGANSTESATIEYQTGVDTVGAFEATVAVDESSDSTLFTVGVRDLLRRAIAEARQGRGTTDRTTTADRALVGAGVGAGVVTRSQTATRSARAVGRRGRGESRWRADEAWLFPNFDTTVLVSSYQIDTDHDRLTISAEMQEAKLEALSRYREAGDLVRESTAFGAFRRVSRDGRGAVSVTPPLDLRPPYERRSVFPESLQAEEIAPQKYDVELELGLEEPRSREPLDIDRDPQTVDSVSLSLDAGESVSDTLQWTPDASEVGEWLATVASDDDSDSELVTVTDAPWVLQFPAGTLRLTRRNVRQIAVSNEDGVSALQLPLWLNAEQAAVVFGVGSRVEATDIRGIPDAPNTVVDTLPDGELSCQLTAPDDADVANGEYILAEWTTERTSPNDRPYRTELTLYETDED